MSKRKTIDKAQARERRNRLLESAATAQLSLTEGVREMRAISGMTQEDFARHRDVSARVIKALELGQGNPTVATLNRIGKFFGLEVGFVPSRQTRTATAEAQPTAALQERLVARASPEDIANRIDTQLIESYQKDHEVDQSAFIKALDAQREEIRRRLSAALEAALGNGALLPHTMQPAPPPKEISTLDKPVQRKKK